MGAVPPPDEPVAVTTMYEVDPFGAARRTLLDEVSDAAGAGLDAQPVLRAARRAHAARPAAELAGDEDMLGAAGECAAIGLVRCAEAPSATLANTAIKLAMLVNDLAHKAPGMDEEEQCHLALAAAALLEVMLLAGGPIVMPHDIGEPIEDAADVARLRARAGRLS